MQAYSYSELLMLGLIRTHTYSYPDSFPYLLIHTHLLILRPTHTRTFSLSELFNARTDTYSYFDLVILRLARGAAKGVFTVPFAASLWGCFRWFACFHARLPWPPDQIVRMSQAGRWFQHL
eukprot:3941062-Pyramimonas_sp.AAC.1